MRSKLLCFLFFVFPVIATNAQIVFEKGYFVRNSGEKVSCLIKNEGWKNNPTIIEYKLTESSSIQTVAVNEISVFEMENSSKYKSVEVDIDRTGKSAADITNNRNGAFKKETLFLKVLLEGKASLYCYVDRSLYIYFFSIDQGNIMQLLQKHFINADNNIEKNNYYRQQIATNLKCDGLSSDDIVKLNYNNNDLVKYFLKYNECAKSDVVNYKSKSKVFSVAITPGVNFSSLSIDRNGENYVDFGNKTTFRLGVEIEGILPFKNNKWAAFLEPSYNYFKAEKIENSIKHEVDYKTIDIAIGFRHYMFLNTNSKIFLNAGYVKSLSLDSKLGSQELGIDHPVKPTGAIEFGTGFNYKNKFTIEYRFRLRQELLSTMQAMSAGYNTSSVILGYRLL